MLDFKIIKLKASTENLKTIFFLAVFMREDRSVDLVLRVSNIVYKRNLGKVLILSFLCCCFYYKQVKFL